jgi:hypothetical protein
MPTLKLEIPQESFEQLLRVAHRAWRPTVWHAEFLLRKAIQEEYDAGERDAASDPHVVADGTAPHASEADGAERVKGKKKGAVEGPARTSTTPQPVSDPPRSDRHPHQPQERMIVHEDSNTIAH